MRTFDEIQKTILDQVAASTVLQGLSTSKAALWRTWVNVIAYVHLILEQIFTQHKTELQTLIANQKKGSLLWYRNMARAFQYGFGFNLIPDSDQFDNSGHTDEEIEASKIVKYAAVTEAESESRLIVKIATEVAGELQPIGAAELAAFRAYMQRVKYAGVQISVINYLPDLLNLQMQIYRDPLILDENGMKITDATYPVNEAIEDYLKNLPFNGELVLAHLVDRLQKVEGVKIPHIVSASTRWIDPTINDYGTAENLSVKKIPVSGYFKLENYNGISYVV